MLRESFLSNAVERKSSHSSDCKLDADAMPLGTNGSEQIICLFVAGSTKQKSYDFWRPCRQGSSSRVIIAGTSKGDVTICAIINRRSNAFRLLYRLVRLLLALPWRTLNRGLLLQITYMRPRRRTTWQSGWRYFRAPIEDTTFIISSKLLQKLLV